MKGIRKEIEACVLDAGPDTGGTIRGAVVFPEGFTGFKGHFPGDPVLPGVCLVQGVLAVLKAGKGLNPRLRELVSAKFLSRVRPGMPLEFECEIDDAGAGDAQVSATVYSGPDKVGVFVLRVEHGGE